MTDPLMALAIGAIVVGFVGVPAALGGPNTIEKFLEPSFSAEHSIADRGLRNADSNNPQLEIRNPESAIRNEEAESHLSRGAELGLMGFSVLLAALGIGVAYRSYVVHPEIAEARARRRAGAPCGPSIGTSSTASSTAADG